MILIGKDLRSLENLRRYVEQNLNGFSVETDELTGELVIRTNLMADDDGNLVSLVGEANGRNMNDGRLIQDEDLTSDLI